MTTLVFATHNPNKAEEINALMPEGYQVRSLTDVGFKDTVHEDQETLAGNALKKARTVYQATGQACFADDTGLEVDALNGAPGVYTARYAGESASDKANVDKIKQMLTSCLLPWRVWKTGRVGSGPLLPLSGMTGRNTYSKGSRRVLYKKNPGERKDLATILSFVPGGMMLLLLKCRRSRRTG
jgi:hypothetical protein